MKILFIHPGNYLSIGIPNGIATLSAVLKREGYQVDLFDFTFIKTKEHIAQLENTLKGIFLPTEYTEEDLVANDPIQPLEQAFKAKLQEFQPDLLAVSVMTGHFDKVVSLLKTVKLPCKVIVGGVHATLCPEDALAFDVIDFVCIGEGEELLLELCDCLKQGKDYSKIRNLGFKKNGNVYLNEYRPFINLDELPLPDWSLFDERHLFRPFMGKIYRGSFYLMSRGCPYQCTYCVNSALRKALKNCGHYFRFQSPLTTINQLSFLKKQYGATWFKFGDDSITLLTEDYLEELADGLKELDIQFGCSVRPETISERKVELLKSMGCVAASIGIESGNEELRKKVLNRQMPDEQIKRAISILQEAGIRVSTFNMIGLPEETREDVFKTISLNKKLNISAVNVYIVYPYPGTEINKKYGVKVRDNDGNIVPVSKAFSFNLSKMSPTEVEGLLKTFNIYVELPETMWPIVKIAEGSDRTAKQLRSALSDYIVSMKKN